MTHEAWSEENSAKGPAEPFQCKCPVHSMERMTKTETRKHPQTKQIQKFPACSHNGRCKVCHNHGANPSKAFQYVEQEPFQTEWSCQRSSSLRKSQAQAQQSGHGLP